MANTPPVSDGVNALSVIDCVMTLSLANAQAVPQFISLVFKRKIRSLKFRRKVIRRFIIAFPKLMRGGSKRATFGSVF